MRMGTQVVPMPVQPVFDDPPEPEAEHPIPLEVTLHIRSNKLLIGILHLTGSRRESCAARLLDRSHCTSNVSEHRGRGD